MKVNIYEKNINPIVDYSNDILFTDIKLENKLYSTNTNISIRNESSTISTTTTKQCESMENPNRTY
jgi:hypothetical protein